MDKDHLDHVISQILPNNLSIKAESHEEGFCPENLIYANGKGWHSATKDQTWVQIDLKTPKTIKVVGIKSNSVSAERDPVEIEIIGRSEGEWFYFAKIKNLNFEERNTWKNVNLMFYGKLIETLKINFIKNHSLNKNGSWEESIHLGEIVLFE